MSLPNFMCIGVAKSGTTSLYDILRQHPDIFLPSFKEPHFFDIIENFNQGLNWYKNTYYSRANKDIIGDFTPSYFFDKNVPKRIHSSLGNDIRFIVLLRDPVDRAYSHYLHSFRDRHESLSFEDALRNEKERLNSYMKTGDYLSFLRHSYYHQGLYGDMTENYFDYFSKDNFFFIHFENEFVKNRESTIISLLDYLDLDKEINLNFNIKSNPASKERSQRLKNFMKRKGFWRQLLKYMIPNAQTRQIIRNRIQRANIIETASPTLDYNFKLNLFDKYFRDNIEKFEKLTEIRLGYYDN